MNTHRFVAAALCGLLATAALADDVLQIEPRWEYATRHRIAVVPVQVDVKAAGFRASEAAAAKATQALEEALRQCGAFDLAPAGVGQGIAQDFHLPRVTETPVGQRGLPEKFASQVDAVVIATLTVAGQEVAPSRVSRNQYELDDDKIERDDLNRPIVRGRETVTLLRKIGKAGGIVQIVDANTGIVLLRYESPLIEIVHENVAPDATAMSLDIAERAGAQLGIDWARQIGPTKVSVDIDNDMLVTAHGWVDDRYDESEKIAPGQGQFIIAVRNLPSSVARLPFVLTLTSDDKKQVWQQGFTWTDDGKPARGTWFVVPVQLLKDTGEDEFRLELFGPGGENKPLAKHKIKLEVP